MGTCTAHTCHCREELPGALQGALHEEEERNLECRGLAVFPRKWGGREVHVLSVVPGWNCAILMRTSDRLHGSVVPCDNEVEGLRVPHLDIMRIVTYPLRRIECSGCRVHLIGLQR